MIIQGEHVQTLRYQRAQSQLKMLDQTRLPFEVSYLYLSTLNDICHAISAMQVRGAPAIGAAAAFGIVFQAQQDASDAALQEAAKALKATRPTAVNLAWAVDGLLGILLAVPLEQREKRVVELAENICHEDIACNQAIGRCGLELIRKIAANKQGPVNILTHCNAGWLATVDWGTALAPVYKAQQAGIDVHVWVDETRPRNQGAMLSAFELSEQGIKHTLISDNSGGYLMQQGEIDLCIVGSDRTAANGDVCNKIGTYLKALAAVDNNIPFYVALPSSTIDWQLSSGKDIPIEYRDASEVTDVQGLHALSGKISSVRICTEATEALNPAFDVTPAKYVSGLITEYGLFQANTESLQQLRAKLD